MLQAISDTLMQLAEASMAYTPLAASERLCIKPEYSLFWGASDHADANCVQRLRLRSMDVEAAVQSVRAQALEHGCRAITWEVSSAAVPANLTQRLLALGMRDARVPSAMIMATSDVVLDTPSDVLVRQVSTLEDFKAHVGVTHAVFDQKERLQAEWERIDELGEYDCYDTHFVRYNALIDGQVVGAATATFSSVGAMLHSGSTLPEYRGRGVYRALIARRWQDAEARGTPFLVTRAGAMSRHLLIGLGFESIGEMRFLVDELAYADQCLERSDSKSAQVPDPFAMQGVTGNVETRSEYEEE